MNKAVAHYYPETNSMMIRLADTPSIESEEMAEDVVLAFDADNNVVAIDVTGSVREIFADLIEKEVQARLADRPAS